MFYGPGRWNGNDFGGGYVRIWSELEESGIPETKESLVNESKHRRKDSRKIETGHIFTETCA